MPTININNSNINFEEEGSGETIVFAHSMLFNLRMFDNQVDHLKDDFRCVRFDFRGQGKSEVAESGYDLDSLTDDVAKLIESLHCNPCHFVGFSMGGMVGMKLAVEHPNLVKSLILIDTSSEIQDDMIRNRAMLWVAKYIGIKVLANKIVSMFFSSNFLKDKKNKPVVKLYKKYFLANDPKGIVKTVKGVLFRKRFTESLGSVTQPTMIIVGENDELTDSKKSKILKENIKQSQLEIIPRAGHLAPVEEPELVNRIIRNFISNLN